MVSLCTCNNFLLVCAIIILSDAVTSKPKPKTNIRALHVVFRHGDRAPDVSEKYPKDPYLDYNFYPEGRGGLTNTGKAREYELGVNLRKAYDAYLSDVVLQNTLSAVSSDYERTKASLQLVLAGLFPPAKIQKWNAQLNWQPIPTRYIRRPVDNLFLSDECSGYLDLYNKMLVSPEGRKAVDPYRGLMKQLSVDTGRNISTPIDVAALYLGLYALYSEGFPLPIWAVPQIPYGPIWNATIMSYEVASFNIQLRRRYAGPLLLTFMDNMKGIVNGTLQDRRKIYLYSGHETNIAALLIALGLWEPQVPPYSSALIFELHEVNEKYYVKLQHYKGIPSDMVALAIPGCNELCPFDTYRKLVKDLIPSDAELVCIKNRASIAL